MRTFEHQQQACRWDRMACYLPSIIWMVLCAWGIAWLTYVMLDRQMANIKPKHYVHGALLWFIMTPVLIGLTRGIRRTARHVRRTW